MKTVLALLLCLILLSFYIPRVAAYKEFSVVSDIDTLPNGTLKVYFHPITERIPLKPGDVKIGDTIKGLILTKP